MFESANVWLTNKMPDIKYEIKSVAQTFLAGASFYLLANWEVIKTLEWSKSALIGLGLAIVRSGWKLVWAFVEPQILSVLKKLSNKQ